EEEGWNFDDFWPSVGPVFFPQSLLTAGMAFDHFAHLLARPQDGAHYRVTGDPVLRSADDTWGTATATRINVPNGATGFYQQVGFGGRPVHNALAEDQGEYNSDFTMNAGSY